MCFLVQNNCLFWQPILLNFSIWCLTTFPTQLASALLTSIIFNCLKNMLQNTFLVSYVWFFKENLTNIHVNFTISITFLSLSYLYSIFFYQYLTISQHYFINFKDHFRKVPTNPFKMGKKFFIVFFLERVTLPRIAQTFRSQVSLTPIFDVTSFYFSAETRSCT